LSDGVIGPVTTGSVSHAGIALSALFRNEKAGDRPKADLQRAVMASLNWTIPANEGGVGWSFDE
jgi:hypothetical protein